MPNSQFYVACQAFSGKAENFFILSFATGSELNTVITSATTQIGPTLYNGKPYYGVLMYGSDEEDINSNSDKRSMLGLFHTPGDEGQAGGMYIETWFNYSPAYIKFGQGTVDAVSAEPTQRVQGNAQTPSIYTHNVQESGFDEIPILISWEYLFSINPPGFNWGRSLTTASEDRLMGSIYFDNWQTYLYWGIYGTVGGDPQYLYIRRYNQIGTLIWSRRIQAPAPPVEWSIGKMAGFDSGNVMVPISYQDGFETPTFVYTLTLDTSGNVVNSGLRTIYESASELGSVSRLMNVISSRPMWDNVYTLFQYLGFGTGGPATTDMIVVSCSNTYNLFSKKIIAANSGYVLVSAIEEPASGDVIILCVQSSGFLDGMGILIFRVRVDGQIIWQRKGRLTASVSGVTKNLGIIHGSISWASDDAFMISLTHDMIGNIGTYQGVGVQKFNTVFSLPMDGSLIGTHTFEFENFDGDPNSETYIILEYEEGTTNFSVNADAETPVTVVTPSTTNPFTQNNISVPTRTAITFDSSGGLVK